MPMTVTTDTDLYRTGCATLIASWETYARGSVGAAMLRLPGVAAAVFPSGPERGVYNNALLDRGMDAGKRAGALNAMEAAYAGANVAGFAAWAHETDEAMRADLRLRGYTIATMTRAMGMDLDDIGPLRRDVEVGAVSWSDYLTHEGLPAEFLATADHAALHPLAIREAGHVVAASLAFDLGGDCGVYNVGTVGRARRRGFGTAVTAAQLAAARARGRRTASLQSTPMAERLYAALGFRDLGRFVEYVRPN
jgi:ribosomal protein S18 acetylase RimI-like enzyme